MRIYISGAITGTKDYLERFMKAERELEAKGYTIINPARVMDQLPEMKYEEYMSISLMLLDMSDAIYMMKGWKDSKGANREYGYAIAKGKTMYFEQKGELK